MSREAVRYAVASDSYVVISVTDPGKPQADLYPSEGLKNVLRLSFHDLDRMPDVAGDWVLFDREMAHSIVRFFRWYWGMVDLVVCQCEAGISRSAGVAAALMKATGHTDDMVFANTLPNRLVYRRILEVWGETT